MPKAETDRAQINRANAQHSTGPRTPAGKERSSQNAFKHGLHSKKFVLPDECAAEFDELRATLRREHQPVNTTEEILVEQLAQNYWRMRRYRELEASAWQPESKLFTPAILALLARSLASVERGFFRSLTALTKLQKERGFVPQQSRTSAASAQTDGHVDNNGFVAEFHHEQLTANRSNNGEAECASVNRHPKSPGKPPLAA